MGDACEGFLVDLRAGNIEHSNDSELTTHVLNAATYKQANGNKRFVRPKESRSAKNQDDRVIDALIAATMIHYAMYQVPEPPTPFAFIIN